MQFPTGELASLSNPFYQSFQIGMITIGFVTMNITPLVRHNEQMSAPIYFIASFIPIQNPQPESKLVSRKNYIFEIIQRIIQ